MVENNSIVQALQEMATLMELKGENPFKIRAFSNAARILSGFSLPIETLVAKNELTEIKDAITLRRTLTDLQKLKCICFISAMIHKFKINELIFL